MLYEVFIPAIEAGKMNVTQKVDAENWLAALRSGLAKIGEQGDIVKNVMCDIQENGDIHVTDPRSGRVFRIKETGEGEITESDDATMAAPAVDKGASWQEYASAPIDTTEHRAAGPEAGVRVMESTETEATADSLAEARVKAQDPEELLADVFEESANIAEFGEDVQGAVEFVMDLVMSKVDCEAGSILFANINEHELYFASARGPKADDVMGYRVPMGKGIVGFCAKEGQALALSNAGRSPLFFKKIAESIGYPARSIACAPVDHEGRSYGAIEVLNRTASDEFTAGELEVLKYLGGKLAEHVSRVIMANA
jgi:hypothetical protein